MKVFLSIFIIGLLTISSIFSAEVILEIDPSLVDVKGDKVIFNKDSYIMKSSYDKYVFDKNEFFKLLGDPKNWEGSMNVVVSTKLSSFKTLFPKDGAVPQGGFKITYYDAKIIEVITDETGQTDMSNDEPREIELLVKARECIDKGDVIIFEPDRSVMRSSYLTYIFDKKEFTKLLGDFKTWKKDLKILASVTQTDESIYMPKSGAAPINGFTYSYYEAKIIKVIK